MLIYIIFHTFAKYLLVEKTKKCMFVRNYSVKEIALISHKSLKFSSRRVVAKIGEEVSDYFPGEANRKKEIFHRSRLFLINHTL